jgi:hypothetical protein
MEIMKFFLLSRSFIIIPLFALLTEQVKAQTSPIPMMGDGSGRPIVILKADDLGGLPMGTPHTTWERFFDVIESNSICASIGIISDNIPTLDPSRTNVINEIINRHNETYTDPLTKEIVHRFEFWNHTADHYDLTLATTNPNDQITNCESFFNTTLGFQANTFGAPFNAINQSTKTAIENNNPIRIWMNMGGFSQVPDLSNWSSLSDQLLYDRDYTHLLLPVAWGDEISQVNLDASGNTRLDYNWFLKSVTVKPNVVTIIELHPAEYINSRGDSSFVALQQIIDNLKSQNALFVTPSYLYNKANIQRYCGDYFGPNSTTISVSVGSLAAGHSWVTPPTTTNCSYTFIHSQAKVTFNAPKTIYLSPGFTAEHGSTFRAANAGGGSVARYASTNIVTKTISVDSKIALYPNPSEGTFTVNFGGEQSNIASIAVYNLTGKEIKTINTLSESEVVDISNQPTGVYIIKVMSNNEVGTYKVVKK